jgi:hypothetical protein
MIGSWFFPHADNYYVFSGVSPQVAAEIHYREEGKILTIVLKS